MLPIKTRIDIVTGYHDEEKADKAKELKADGYLTKPLPMGKLMEVVRRNEGNGRRYW